MEKSTLVKFIALMRINSITQYRIGTDTIVMYTLVSSCSIIVDTMQFRYYCARVCKPAVDERGAASSC